jgi:cysteinyl-tRNA synthetase
LADNFNSRSAVASISELINDLNKEFKVANISSTYPILLDITKWITQILATFGFEASTQQDRLGWSDDRDSLLPEIKKAVRYRDIVRAKAISKSGSNEIENLTRHLESLLTFQDSAFSPYRKGINNFTSTLDKLTASNAPFTEYLQECDRFRDETMLELGISIDDTDFGIATIRFADASRLIAERDQKRAVESAAADKKAAEKQKRKDEEDRKAREKLDKGKVSPEELFRTEEYSKWDDEVLCLMLVVNFRVFQRMMLRMLRLQRRKGKSWSKIGRRRRNCMRNG